MLADCMFGNASAPALEEKGHNVLCRREERMLRYWSTLINGAMYESGRQFVEMTLPIKNNGGTNGVCNGVIDFFGRVGKKEL